MLNVDELGQVLLALCVMIIPIGRLGSCSNGKAGLIAIAIPINRKERKHDAE